jgi:hypothetical protein
LTTLVDPKAQARLVRRSLAEPAAGRPFGAPPWVFDRAAPVVLGLAVTVIAVVDAGRAVHGRRDGTWLPLNAHPVLAAMFGAIGLAGLILVFLDLATYRPRLFTLASAGPPSRLAGGASASSGAEEFFSALAEHSDDLKRVVQELRVVPPGTWSEVTIQEENLLKEASNFFLLDHLRAAVTTLVVKRFVLILVALTLVAYGLAGLDPHVVRNMPAHADILWYGYFTVSVFFTIGFGDLLPGHPWGFAFVGLTLVTLVLTTYFVLSDIGMSYLQFETNVRHCARRFVMSLTSM